MARRSTEEVLAEFNRLYDCFEGFESAMRSLNPNHSLVDGVDYTVTREEMLACVSEKKVTASQILAGIREAVNDGSEMLSLILQDDPQSAKLVLAKYREQTGRDYWEDAGHPAKMIKAILRRGYIADDTEYRLVNGHLGNGDPHIIPEKSVAQVTRLLASYPDAVSTNGRKG